MFIIDLMLKPIQLVYITCICGGGEQYGYNDVTINVVMDITLKHDYHFQKG